MPNNANQLYKWTKDASAGTVVAVENDANCDNGKRLVIDTSTTDTVYCRYGHTAAGKPWYDYVNNASGWVVEARIKVIDSGSGMCQNLIFIDGTYYLYVNFTASVVSVPGTYLVETTQTYSIDLTDAYHIIRVEVTGTSLVVKIDGTTRITGTLDYSLTGQIFRFGDSSIGANYGGECYWDYVKYKVT